MTDVSKLTEAVVLLKELVDFVHDHKKVNALLKDVAAVKKVGDDLEASKKNVADATKLLAIASNVSKGNAVKEKALADKEKEIVEQSLNADRNSAAAASDRAEAAILLQEAKKTSAAAKDELDRSKAANAETQKLLLQNQSKSAELDKAITDYKEKLAKLAVV